MAREMNTQHVRRSLKIALFFQIAWLIAGLLFTVLGAKVQWGLLVLNMFTLWVPALLMFATRMRLTDGFQFGYYIFITSSSLIGSSLGGYGAIPNWDTLVHIYSGTLLAWFGFSIASTVEGSIKKPLPLWFKNIFALMTPLAFAVLWEIYEFMSDTLWGTSMQAGGLEDTIVDMLAALVGAVAMVTASALWFLRRK